VQGRSGKVQGSGSEVVLRERSSNGGGDDQHQQLIITQLPAIRCGAGKPNRDGAEPRLPRGGGER
jgi:hypothetical protein